MSETKNYIRLLKSGTGLIEAQKNRQRKKIVKYKSLEAVSLVILDIKLILTKLQAQISTPSGIINVTALNSNQ